MIAAVGGLEDKVGRKSRGILEIRRKKKKKDTEMESRREKISAIGELAREI